MTNDDGRKPEGAPERSPKAGVGAPSGVDGNGAKRFSVQRKMAIVARLLRGEPLEVVARETNVSIAKLTEWRERALAGAATALKERERDDRDDEIARLKSKVGEITMDNELLYAKIEALEGKRPLAHRTHSRRRPKGRPRQLWGSAPAPFRACARHFVTSKKTEYRCCLNGLSAIQQNRRYNIGTPRPSGCHREGSNRHPARWAQKIGNRA